MLMTKYKLRIGVRSHENRLFIPRHVGPTRYCAKKGKPSKCLIDKHMYVVRRCLSRSFFTEQTYAFNEGKKPLCIVHNKLLVDAASGDIKVRYILKEPPGVEAYYLVYFYVPLMSLNGRKSGYVEIRNVQSLYEAFKRLYPDIKSVEDI